MSIVVGKDIRQRLDADGASALVIDPLLDDGQIQSAAIDLRLGYDFLVSVTTRKPSIDVGASDNQRAIGSYFQETRRDLGERFVLYPHQVVLSCTLEYIALPADCYADISARSSYTRLGIPIATWIQPGFRGCAPLELFNHGNTPVELVVGCRICQLRLYPTGGDHEYLSKGVQRKYFGDVRPRVSSAEADADLGLLEQVRVGP